MNLAPCFAVAIIILLLATLPRGTAAQPDAALVALYTFDDPADLGADTSGKGHRAAVTAATAVPGREGQGLRLDGRGGMEIDDTTRLHFSDGFAVECWVRFEATNDNFCLISKEGEFFIRTDPPNEGGNISFFVNAGGSAEPRVRGIAPKIGEWTHIIAAWDGQYAYLWINGRQFQTRRPGTLPATRSPLLIGKPFKWAPAGLKGTMDEVKVFSRAVTEGEVISAEYDLGRAAEPLGGRVRNFEFTADAGGWTGHHAENVRAHDGCLEATIAGAGSALVLRGLELPLSGGEYVSVRMSVSAGETGRLAFLASGGAGAAAFALKADGQMHSYVVHAGEQPEWDGTLRALALAPSDSPAQVRVDFIRISDVPAAPPEISVRMFLPEAAISRAGRPTRLVATIQNTGGPGNGLRAMLTAPAGIAVEAPEQVVPEIGFGETRDVVWSVQAAQAGPAELGLKIAGAGATPVLAQVTVPFGPELAVARADYVPPPQPVDTGKYLVGCHYCPLWKQSARSGVWELITPFPERKPALGWYDEDNPEVTDWEIKWALEHGIQYFVYCWYRRGQGKPVEMSLGHAIHDGLMHARYKDKFKFAIMWENQSRGTAGIASEEDFLQNLLPFWIENYFKDPSYLKVDNKPLLFIYRPEFLVDDLGSVEAVRRALDKAREACRQAGFDGLTILGEYRGTAPAPLQLMVQEGLDYAFAYCWPVPSVPPAEAIAAQEAYWRNWQQQNIIPYLITLSMGWDSTPWHPSYTMWRLPPPDFETLCERGKQFMATLPETSLGSRLVLLDNWNEFGEGHYIAPHRQYGFGYLDAVRKAFAPDAGPHVDIVPEDVGLGPYETGYRAFIAPVEACRRRVTAPGAEEPGLVAWWTFDEDDGPCAFDYTGNGQGGLITDAERVPGLRGKALACHGGNVTIPRGELRCPTRAITVECWVKTDTPDQTDKWFVNNVFGTGESGFRLGLSGGRLTWAVPKTAWSHHLVADAPLPLGQWVHVAATYDGKTLHLYMDGRECGTMERGGRINAPSTHTSLGSYDRNHRAFFSGLLDEVKLYSRALSPGAVALHARAH